MSERDPRGPGENLGQSTNGDVIQHPMGAAVRMDTLSCAKTRPIGLRGLAVVELEHAAEARAAPDRASAD
jgi:hypothetical protein